MPPLQAGWLEGLGPLVVVAFWIIRQVMVALQEQKEVEKARQEAAERAARGEVETFPESPVEHEQARLDRPQQPKEQPQGDLRSEVEEFLRRLGEGEEPVQKRKAQPTPDPRGEQPQRAPKRAVDPFEEPPRRRPRPTRESPIEIEIEPVVTPEPTPATRPVGERPKASRPELRHLPESQLAEQAAHLGERISQSDERTEARLHQKFDHRLGKLSEPSATEAKAPAAEPTSAAARIKAMLTRPGGAREAVVLSEIFRRPDDRF